MEYKINPSGVIKITKDGLYTSFEALVPSGVTLLRLYAEGNGRRVSLGIMENRGKYAVLRKRLSRIDMEVFPHNIKRFFTLPFDEKPREIKPEENKSSDKILRCTELPDGCLRVCDGFFTYMALPAKLKTSPFGIRIFKYRGQEYMLFRY